MSPLSSRNHPGQRAHFHFFSRQEGLLFVLPALLFFALFVLYPILYILRASLFEWGGLSAGTWVGLDNYRKLFTADAIFLKALRNAVLWLVSTIVPRMFLGFGLAVLLNGPILGRTKYRSIFYLPTIVSPIVAGIIWKRSYNPFGGLLSDVARQSGLHWLAQRYPDDPTPATCAAIAVNVWQCTGFSMLLCLAGLQGLSGEALEAATPTLPAPRTAARASTISRPTRPGRAESTLRAAALRRPQRAAQRSLGEMGGLRPYLRHDQTASLAPCYKG